MSQPKEHKPPAGPKVSPVRTIISLLLLLVVGVICAIELRAGLGQFLTGKAFAAKSEEGVFTNVKLSEAKSMVSMFPTETLHRSSPSETVVKFEWFSLLQPLIRESSPQMYITATGGDDPSAINYHTDAGDDDTVAAPSSGGGSGPPGGMGGPGGMSMPGMGGPGGMSMPGMGGPGGGGRGPGGGRGAGGKDRPDMEEEPAATITPPVDTPATDTPATDTPPATDAPPDDTPATDTPATDTPATDTPATDTPATDAPTASNPGGVPPQ